MASVPPRRVLELSSETVAGNVWQNLSIERYRSHTGIAVLPVVILSDAAAPGLTPVRENPDAGEARHREYALTWFSLAATTLVLWIALNLKRAR
jgi:surfeit locus 1 family protein